LTREVFKNIFNLYFDEIRRYIYYRGGDSNLADDVTQQAFIKLWEKRAKFLPGSERALLYKIAGNEFIDQIRKKKNELEFSKNFTLETESIPPDDLLEYEELNKKFQQVLQKMNENQRVVFLMSRNDGLKYHEIATRLNISVKAVEKRMKVALAMLRLELKPK
jgi:RNA polymerase sigma-70 factor (family 1)